MGVGTMTYSYGTGEDTGRLTRVDLPFGFVEYAYDVHGKVRRETRTLNVNHSGLVGHAGTAKLQTTQSVEREYTVQGQPRKATWDNGLSWTYEYDVRGLLQNVFWSDPTLKGAKKLLAKYERGLSGLPRRRLTNYGQQRDYGYDIMGRITHDRVFLTANQLSRSERNYGFDAFGDLRLITGSNDGINVDAQFQYDARHRVTQADGPHTYRGVFNYTKAGNVTRATVSGAKDLPDRDVSYTYSQRDTQAVDSLISRANSSVQANFAYDDSGNMTERTTAFGTRHMTWDADDQLRGVEGDQGDETYYYGPNRERWLAIGNTVRLWFGESETHFTTEGTQTRRYQHISAGESLARVENGTDLELQYADALKNLMVTLNRTGAVTSSFTYGAFGELVSATGVETHSRQFNGKENDAASGLRFYGFRSYDPLTLRWASADPLFRFAPERAWSEPQRANLYAFSLNNPLRYYDPDGRNPNPEGPPAVASNLSAWDMLFYLMRLRLAERQRRLDAEHLAANPWEGYMPRALSKLGIKEDPSKTEHNPDIVEMWNSTTFKPGTDDEKWCAAYVNWALHPFDDGTGSAMALSFKDWGESAGMPAYGSVAVIDWHNKGAGHVGFVVGWTAGKGKHKNEAYIVLAGGNQDDSVNYTAIRADKILDYRIPPDTTLPNSAYILPYVDVDVANATFENTR
jgi:uncharacterized protein (TIGR02594 family)